MSRLNGDGDCDGDWANVYDGMLHGMGKMLGS
jgi:hypothetical protein